MASLLFVDTNLDWSNFSVAGNIRQKHPGTSVQLIWNAKLTTLPNTDELFLSGHGDKKSSGRFTSPADLAKELMDRDLPLKHKQITFLTCQAGALDKPSSQTESFAQQMKKILQSKGYADLQVKAGRGFVVVFPDAKATAVKNKKGAEAGKAQGLVEDNYVKEMLHCEGLVKGALANPTQPILEKAADEISITLAGFYKDLAVAFEKFLKPEARAFEHI